MTLYDPYVVANVVFSYDWMDFLQMSALYNIVLNIDSFEWHDYQVGVLVSWRSISIFQFSILM